MITFGNYENFNKTFSEVVKDMQEQTAKIINKTSKTDLDEIQNYLDEVMNKTNSRTLEKTQNSTIGNVTYNLYEQDSGNEFVIEIELPGFSEDEITAYVKDNILTVVAKAEPTETRNYLINNFSIVNKEFKISLTPDIAGGIWNAELRNGVLRYTIQKISPKDNSMYINFKAK